MLVQEQRPAPTFGDEERSSDIDLINDNVTRRSFNCDCTDCLTDDDCYSATKNPSKGCDGFSSSVWVGGGRAKSFAATEEESTAVPVLICDI